LADEFDFQLALWGFQGLLKQQEAEVINDAVNTLIGQIAKNPGIAVDLAAEYASENPALVSGRLAANTALTIGGYFVGGVRGSAVGYSSLGFAVHGNLVNAVEENGELSLKEAMNVIVTGRNNNTAGICRE